MQSPWRYVETDGDMVIFEENGPQYRAVSEADAKAIVEAYNAALNERPSLPIQAFRFVAQNDGDMVVTIKGVEVGRLACVSGPGADEAVGDFHRKTMEVLDRIKAGGAF